MSLIKKPTKVALLTSAVAVCVSLAAFATPDNSAAGKVAPNDPLYRFQWNLERSPVGVSAPGAWAQNADGTGAVIAFLDGGYTVHPELSNRVSGWDFISDPELAIDGTGRDSDPRDVGDWMCLEDTQTPPCSPSRPDFIPSSWLSTSWAGVALAARDNHLGLVGVAPGAKMLSITGFGLSQGSEPSELKDLSDAIRWSVGSSIAGVPKNLNKADVVFLPLYNEGACPAILQSAIDFAVSQKAVVVVAANGLNADTSTYYPENCKNVIAVGGTDKTGRRYQNVGDAGGASGWGAAIDVSAPAGDYPMLTNTGLMQAGSPGYFQNGYEIPSYGIKGLMGTPFAAAHVAGVAAMIKGYAKARGRNLSHFEVENLIKFSANRFPQKPDKPIGTGIVNAERAVAATRIYLSITKGTK